MSEMKLHRSGIELRMCGRTSWYLTRLSYGGRHEPEVAASQWLRVSACVDVSVDSRTDK